ncbi:hypothetical protein L210DRAFT_3509909 [Boletus edulis BED1]|uniref:Uncharacterized protein n=1 Tax=Boletus edulis BED1 TaxID=1328754 RepID=A0AAD4BEF0_BOLED|nr:hypothetical protein L210DRAFT_3509909 [Boletus edulis BED1]
MYRRGVVRFNRGRTYEEGEGMGRWQDEGNWWMNKIGLNAKRYKWERASGWATRLETNGDVNNTVGRRLEDGTLETNGDVNNTVGRRLEDRTLETNGDVNNTVGKREEMV